MQSESVILLHGLARTKRSLKTMEQHLCTAGYSVLNAGYPSRRYPIDALARMAVPAAVDECRRRGSKKIHFVTHSMGAILVRCYLNAGPMPDLGRVVMISPPSQGSEVVDKLRENIVFKWLNGPAGAELGTDRTSLPLRLGKAAMELGVIAGDRSINPLLSLMIPGPNDGKVSVERTKLEGMKDFVVVHAPHPFIMNHRETLRQVVAFLRTGRFTGPV